MHLVAHHVEHARSFSDWQAMRVAIETPRNVYALAIACWIGEHIDAWGGLGAHPTPFP